MEGTKGVPKIQQCEKRVEQPPKAEVIESSERSIKSKRNLNKSYYSTSRKSVVSELYKNENESIRCWNNKFKYQGVPFLNVTSPRFSN